MARCRTNCIEKQLAAVFQTVGGFIGRHPLWFFVTPLLVSAALGSGFMFLKEREANDIEDQFTPVDGPAKKERQFVQDQFPFNDSEFSRLRMHNEGTYASLIAVSRSENILTEHAFEEIIRLDKEVKALNVVVGDERVTYSSLCATTNGKCVTNAVLDIINYTASEITKVNITLPVTLFNRKFVFLGSQVGGVELNSTRKLNAKAIRLHYFLRENETASKLWLDAFIKTFANETTHGLNEVSVSYFTSVSRQEEFKGNTKSVIPFFSITYFLAINFSILSCLRLDCVRNKVWVATVGVLSAGLAVLSSFGLLLHCGIPFSMTAASSPFLILGIGVDDMFILISCWQQTNVHDRVKDRLADTYKEAAVSITITTLTDALAFYIGVMTPFRSVQSFCLYTGTAVVFCYIYSITFFGAFLALNGRREESNRHWLTCMKVPVECPPERSGGYRACCVGGAYDHDTGKEEAMPVQLFFRKYYGPFLTQKWTKAFVMLLYAGYLAVGIYGCFQIQEGIDLRNLATDDSYVRPYYDDEKKYFSVYGPNVMVVVKDKFSYWDEKERQKLDSCIENFKSLPFIDKDLITAWFHEYDRFGKRAGLNLSDENTFKERLIPFLTLSDFKQDVNLTSNKTYASRFFIQTINITTAVDEKNMLNELRETAIGCPVPLLVYHPAFIYYDQYAVIVRNTIQNILVATGAMLVISLLLIPSLICSLWVTFAIASVIVGVAGFMALWEVNLDSISMINLVICIGFSVDFSAHISYAFVSSKERTANEKAIDSLFTLGYPIVQGAVSTILGVVVLSAAKSYIFRTFFKIMLLVISFGLAHGIAFIPVFLTLCEMCQSAKVQNRGKASEDEITMMGFSNSESLATK
ncbi:patched domain-containing protein 3-like [Megalops cyprinoides]|uniref:patched domain-containing protein 3-like n=1 Tax=Megalops cyprinoides TaxID=118141 RepID=UPI0018649744|nr:patched domain-containing protein 3-like [Megalops cyprinoides]